MYPIDTLSIFFLFTYDTLLNKSLNKKKKADIFLHILECIDYGFLIPVGQVNVRNGGTAQI